MTKTLINHIYEVWEELEKTTSMGTSKRLYSEHLMFPIYGVIQIPEHRYGIAFSFSKNIIVDIAPFSSLSSLFVRLVTDNSFPDKQLLIIQIAQAADKDIFSSLCENLIFAVSTIDAEKLYVKTVINQLERWKSLFENKRRNGLSISEQNGLWGELHFLKKLLLIPNINKRKAIQAWVGPDMAVRDFQYNNNAVEVKTTSVNNADVVTINGARQLDETNLASLHLFHCCIEGIQGDCGTLNDKVKDIEELISDDYALLCLFRAKLFEVGYEINNSDLYANRHIELRKEQCFHIKDSFPRIKENEIRGGISNLEYEINLAACGTYQVSESKTINSLEL